MKKAQILSAIALAFALGVVAPVAGVFAADITVGDIQDTASKESLSNAIQNVKANTSYGAYNTMYTAAGAGTVANKWTDINETTLMNAINTALSGLYAEKADLAPADYEAAETLADAIKNAEGVSLLIPEYQNLIAAVKSVSGANPASYDSLVKLAQAAKLSVEDDNDEKSAANLAAAIAGSDIYEAYDTLNTALTNAKNAIEDQKNHVDDLKNALAFASDAITPTMIANAATVTKTNTTPVDNLVSLANTALASERGAKFVALIQEVSSAEGVLKNNASTEANYAAAIKALNTDYKAATDTDLSLATPVVTPDDGNNGSTGTGDNSTNAGDEDKNGITAGDQGVIANAEGNASASAGIMAAVATALTAAGVGVVAFRNARRSSKKA